MVIKYIAYTWQGEKVEGVLNVDREEEAQAMLQRDDLIPRLAHHRQPILHDDTRGLAINQQICHNLRMPKGEFDLPMDGGPEFPFDDLVVNAGLALRGV